MRRYCSVFAFITVAAIGCGDNLDLSAPDAGSVEPDAAESEAAEPTALFVNGDFNVTGILSQVDVVNRTVVPNVLAAVAGGDPVIRRVGTEVFIVNRFGGNNVTVLGGSPLALVDQFATGDGTNPQDVAVVGNKLYVPVYDSTGVAVINRTTRAMTTIDLHGVNAANDVDGKPECASVFAVGTRVFVTCQRLANFAAVAPGRVVVINSTTDTVESSFDLGTQVNPVGLLQPTPTGGIFGGDLLVAMVNYADVPSGCLARIRTTGTPSYTGCAAMNSALNGQVNRVDVTPEGDTAWLAVFRYGTFPEKFGHLRQLNLMTGAISEPVTPETGVIFDVAACGDDYVVATAEAGLRIWHEGTETTTTPLALGRDPSGPQSLVCF